MRNYKILSNWVLSTSTEVEWGCALKHPLSFWIELSFPGWASYDGDSIVSFPTGTSFASCGKQAWARLLFKSLVFDYGDCLVVACLRTGGHPIPKGSLKILHQHIWVWSAAKKGHQLLETFPFKWVYKAHGNLFTYIIHSTPNLIEGFRVFLKNSPFTELGD